MKHVAHLGKGWMVNASTHRNMRVGATVGYLRLGPRQVDLTLNLAVVTLSLTLFDPRPLWVQRGWREVG